MEIQLAWVATTPRGKKRGRKRAVWEYSSLKRASRRRKERKKAEESKATPLSTLTTSLSLLLANPRGTSISSSSLPPATLRLHSVELFETAFSRGCFKGDTPSKMACSWLS